MTVEVHELRRKRALSLLVGLAFSALLSGLALQRVAWGDVAASLAAAQVWPWIPLGAASYLAGHLVRGARCRLLVSADTSLPLSTATAVVVLGYATNNVLPARLGELVRAGMLAERSGVPVTQALSVTALERVLDAATILVLLLLSTAVVGGSALTQSIVPVAAAVVGAGLLAFVGLAAAPELVVRAVSRLTVQLAPSLQARLVRAVQLVAQGAAVLRRPRSATRVLVLSMLVWLLEAGMFLAVLPAFGLAPDPWWALLAMTVTNLGILVPSTPGYIGPFHFFCMSALVGLGVEPAVALSVAVAVHVTFFVPVTLLGGVVAVGFGVRVADTWAVVTAARSASTPSTFIAGAEVIAVLDPAEPPPPPSPFIVALTGALVHEAVRGLPDDARRAAVAHAAGFVVGQVAALEPRLRTLFGIGMWGFRAWVRLTSLRGFCDLPEPARVRHVHQWCYGPVSLTRQLFRAPRSTALLAVYEVVRP